MNQHTLKPQKALLIFGAATLYFYLLLFTLFPFLKSSFSFNAALYWFITGYGLFLPLFLFALVMVRREGNKSVWRMLSALSLRGFSKSNWYYALFGTLLAFLATGIIFGISMLSQMYFGTKSLEMTPWFIEMQPFQGNDRFLLLVWLPMFFFNIAGEELLWRGYVQARLAGKHTWLLCSFLWLVFHLPFGFDLILMLLPVTLIIPWIFAKTRNTLVGIFIHGIYNGPIFIAVALGLIK